jgi:hypothetical protein
MRRSSRPGCVPGLNGVEVMAGKDMAVMSVAAIYMVLAAGVG